MYKFTNVVHHVPTSGWLQYAGIPPMKWQDDRTEWGKSQELPLATAGQIHNLRLDLYLSRKRHYRVAITDYLRVYQVGGMIQGPSQKPWGLKRCIQPWIRKHFLTKSFSPYSQLTSKLHFYWWLSLNCEKWNNSSLRIKCQILVWFKVINFSHYCT